MSTLPDAAGSTGSVELPAGVVTKGRLVGASVPDVLFDPGSVAPPSTGGVVPAETFELVAGAGDAPGCSEPASVELQPTAPTSTSANRTADLRIGDASLGFRFETHPVGQT